MKFLTTVLVTIAMCSSVAASGEDYKTTRVLTNEIQAILDSVSPTNIRAYLDTLVSFTNRHTMDDTVSTATGMGAARRWIYQKFQEFSVASGGRLQPQYFSFTASVCGITQTHRNVMAVLPGSVTPNRYFVVSGHVDTRGDPNNACLYGIFSPGANDDGSGTVVSLELARVLSRYQFDASIIFMTVTGEDEGLFGSEAYAAFAQANGMRIDGMITNDVVGNIVGSNGITDSMSVRHFSSVNDATPHRQMARYIKLKTQQFYPAFTINLIPDVDRPGRGGDHQSFQNHGFTAVRFVEPNENLANQHTATDIVANLSPAYIARIASVNALGLASLAWAPEKPSAPSVTDPGTGTSIQVQWTSVPTVSDFAGYRVAIRDSGGLFYTQVNTAGNVIQYTVNGLTPGLAVYVSISAYDSAGNESMFSGEMLAKPAIAPSAPPNFTSTSFATNVKLNWTASPQLDVAKYRIYRSAFRNSGFTRYDSVTAPGTTYTDAALTSHQLWYYQVRAVDVDGNESTPAGSVAGQLVTHDLGVLVIDATKDGIGGQVAPTDAAVDTFYNSILDGFSVTREWDIADSVAFTISISDADMAPYSTVVLHSDVRTSNPIAQDTAALRKYVQQGGRLFVSGWRLSTSFKANATAGFNSYPPGSFVPVLLKVDSTFTSGPLTQDFYTATSAASGFANLQVDSVKIAIYGSTLINTDAVLLPFSSVSTQTVYTHHGKTPGSSLEGKPIGWRYLGSDFKVTVFDFPLYYMFQVQAKAALRKALTDMGELVDVKENAATIPIASSLDQNYPNPFNPITKIGFQITNKVLVSLKVFDVLGREVATLVNEEMSPGSYQRMFEGTGIASGVYFYRLQAGGFVQSRKLLLLK